MRHTPHLKWPADDAPVQQDLCTKINYSQLLLKFRFDQQSLSASAKQFKNFGCKTDDYCLSKVMSSTQEAFAHQVLNVASDIAEPMEIQEAARRYLLGKACAVEFQQKYVWRAPQGLSAFETFSYQIIFKLSQHLKT